MNGIKVFMKYLNNNNLLLITCLSLYSGFFLMLFLANLYTMSYGWSYWAFSKDTKNLEGANIHYNDSKSLAPS